MDQTKVLNEILTKVTSMEEEMQGIRKDVAEIPNIKTSIDKLDARMGRMESRMDGMETRMGSMESNFKVMYNFMLDVEDKHGKKLDRLLEDNKIMKLIYASHEKRISSLEETAEDHSIKIDRLLNAI